MKGGWGEAYGRAMGAVIRSGMLLLAVLDIVNTMMQHTQTERTLTMIVFPAFLLLGREVIKE